MSKYKILFSAFILFIICGRISTGQDLNIKWDLKSLGDNDMGNPTTIISLNVSDYIYEIAKETGNVSEISKDDFKDYHIPNTAIIACQSWWAGAGAQYWVVKKIKHST